MEWDDMIHIDGFIETSLDVDTWLDAFILWLESRGEYFGGTTHMAEYCTAPRCTHKTREEV